MSLYYLLVCNNHIVRRTDCRSSGIGQPRFSSEDSCTYIFDWETQYACIDKPASCQLLAGRQLFDLSSLMRTSSMGMSLTSACSRVQYLHCADYKQLRVYSTYNIQNDCQSRKIHLINTVAILSNDGRSMQWFQFVKIWTVISSHLHRLETNFDN